MSLLDADLKYEIQEEFRGARIKVVGVGGGGSNAVARMIDEGLDGVDFHIINTDQQALASSGSPNKLQIGAKITNGLGAGSDPALGRTLFGEWAARVEKSRVDRRPSTLARDSSVMHALVLPTFGQAPLGSISPIGLQQWVAELSGRGYAPATVRKAYQLLSFIIEQAVTSGLIPRSPCRGVDLPQVEQADKRFLNHHEIRDLAEVIPARYRALVLTAAYTGCRFGELAALRVARLELLRRALRVEETLNEVRGRIVVGPPKTRSSRRTISLPSFLVETIAEHLTAYPAGPAGYVFTAPGGGPLRRNAFRVRTWLPAVRASVGEPCTFHDLRHSHSALLIAEGVHPKVLQERLGHVSIKTTLDIYGHLFEGLDAGAADALDAAWRGFPAASPRPDAASAIVSMLGR